MLIPETDRLDYGEQLNPPTGYELDSAIATTYSLDLDALLAVPVALYFNDTLDGDLKGENLALMEAIGQLKGKLKVFYQKGNISCPPRFNRLYTLLEPCLHAVVPKGGAYSSFHPKLWLLRFIESEPAKRKTKVCYRLIVLSRNLTFDRSWDIALSLDGMINTENAKPDDNKQWIDFIKQLLSEDKNFRPALDMKKELGQVVWKAPNKFTDLKLLIGGGENGRPVNFEQQDNDELLVVSPFLKSTGGGISALEWLGDFSPHGEKYLFSRAEELNAVGEEKLADWHCFAINDNVVNGEERHEINNTAAGEDIKQQNLHAKLIIQQKGKKAYWHIGSANATNAAMGDAQNPEPRNTEMMVTMVGANDKVGSRLLREQWVPNEGCGLFIKHEFQVVEKENNDGNKQLIRQTVHQLICGEWKLIGKLTASAEKENTYTLTLDVKLKNELEKSVSVSVKQLAVPGRFPLADEVIWKNVEIGNISALIAVHVTIERNGLFEEERLLIDADIELEGGDTRHQYIMKTLVDTPDKVMNYLRLLLQVNPDKNQWLSFDGSSGEGDGASFLSDSPILEQLLIASSRHPKLLKRVDSSLKRLKAAEVDIPTEFSGLWEYFEKEIPK